MYSLIIRFKWRKAVKLLEMSNECRFPASKMQPEKKVKHSENFALIYLAINSATQKKKTVQHSRLAVINVSGTKS